MSSSFAKILFAGDFDRIRRQLLPSGAHHRFWLHRTLAVRNRINIPTLLAFDAASTLCPRANRLCEEMLDFPIQGSALSRSQFNQSGLETRWNAYQ
ncbi:MAG: hypothetical protein DMG32_24940 [Acidobacteria bacterium]|nr:MAG: hypothetical protein DMG32_24940 [Acidobacteriota bacterium]